MGKGEIISGGENGLYNVKIIYNRTRVNNMISALQGKKTEMETEQTTADDNYTAKSAELTAKKGELATLITDFETLTDDYEGLQTSLSTLRLELESLEAEDPPDEDAIDAKQAEIDETEEDIDETYDDIQENIEEQNTAYQEAATLTLELHVIQTEIDRLALEQTAIDKRIEYLQTKMPEDTTVEAYCADLTEDLSGTVGTIEVPGEGHEYLNIFPGYYDEDSINAGIAAAESTISDIQKAVEDEIVQTDPATEDLGDPEKDPEEDGSESTPKEDPKSEDETSGHFDPEDEDDTADPEGVGETLDGDSSIAGTVTSI